MNDEMRDILRCAGIPDDSIAEHHFGKPVNTPYAVYYVDDEFAIYADDTEYTKYAICRLELYTDKFKDHTLTRRVKKELKKREINYEINEDYFKDEDLYLVTFEYEVLVNE